MSLKWNVNVCIAVHCASNVPMCFGEFQTEEDLIWLQFAS
jgi:hypothetical protein